MLATSDVPAGVVNILTGRTAELAPLLAAHMDVNAIDLTGVTDPDLALACEREAAGNVKRVVRRRRRLDRRSGRRADAGVPGDQDGLASDRGLIRPAVSRGAWPSGDGRPGPPRRAIGAPPGHRLSQPCHAHQSEVNRK